MAQTKYSTNGTSSSEYFSDAEEIFAQDDTRFTEVPVPEWSPNPKQPRKVILRNMGGPQRLEFDSRGVNYDVAPGAPGRLNDDWFRENYKLEMIINCAVKPDGTPLFRMAQLKQLGMRNPKPIERLFQAARQLNGYDTDEFPKGTVVTAIGSSPIDSLSLSEGGTFAASSENSQEK